MTDKEILEGYQNLIAEKVFQLYKKYNLANDLEKQRFLNKYRERFLGGFRESIEKGKAETARNMLQEGVSMEIIVKVTGRGEDIISQMARSLDSSFSR